MRIANNFPALKAFKSLNSVNKKLQKTVSALSTGLRLNSSSDDATGFAISERMRSQLSSLDIAVKNSQDGVSLLQTAEGALSQTNSMLQRMRELAVQASNSALTSTDRHYIQLEIDELKTQIDNIAKSTQFNKKNILDGSSGALSSSSDINLKAKINGSLSYIDEFGQKISSEGNYKIEISAGGGKPQVQKSSPMLVKNENVMMSKVINNSAGINDININNLPSGFYHVESEAPENAHSVITGAYGIELDELDKSLKTAIKNEALQNNASILFEVTDADKDSGNITVRASANLLSTDGTMNTIIKENIVLNEEKSSDLSGILGLGQEGAFELQLQSGASENFEPGSKFIYNLNVVANVDGADRLIKITNENAVNGTQEIYKTNSINLKENVFVPAKVLFLIDDSGSMLPMINTIKSNVVNFISSIKNSGADEVSVGVASYSAWPAGVHTLRKHTMSGNDWSQDMTEIQGALNDITLGGGSEDHYKAVTDAISGYNITSGGEPAFIVLVTDTRQEMNNGVSKNDAVSALKDAGISCSIIRPENASTDLDELADSTDGLKFDKNSQTWGSDLSGRLGTKIGADAVNAIKLQDMPLYQFEEFEEIFPKSTSPSQVITVIKDGEEKQIEISPLDTFNALAAKLDTTITSKTSVDVNNGIKSVNLTLTLSSEISLKFPKDSELLNKLGFRSNLEQDFSLNAGAVKNKNVHFQQFYINSQNGKVYESDISITTDFEKDIENLTFYSDFESAYVGQIPKIDTNLSDISTFYNSEGVFMLESPKTLRITQGDGKTAEIILYENDTVEDVRMKINDAIAKDLGQSKYADSNKFASYIEEGRASIEGEEAVAGTFVIRSAVPGKAGELYFSGDEDLLNALGLNTIQESQEAEYTASVYDAHSGAAVAVNVKSSAPEFKSLIPPEIDIEVEPMTGLSANWDETTRRFIMARKNVYTAMLHLKNNGTVFQVGADAGEDFMIQLGDISCKSLGISSVNVLTRETASRAIGILDSAINKLASQRSEVGAYENALERTMENLTTMSMNLTVSESRIRDADISKTMMDFVKYKILNQSGSSMLAQANQMPQSVLSLMQ